MRPVPSLLLSGASLAHPLPSMLLYMFPPLSLISPTGKSKGSSPIYHHDSPTLAEETLAGGDNSAAPVRQGSAVPGEPGKFQPSSSVNGSLGLVCDRLNLVAASLAPRAAETIQTARSFSMYSLYNA